MTGQLALPGLPGGGRFSRGSRDPEKTAAHRRAYRAAHPEKIAAGMRAYRLANPKKMAARDRAYYAANAAKRRAYRLANPEEAAARYRAYREANPEKMAAKAARYRAWVIANPEKVAARKRLRKYNLTQAEHVALLAAQDGRCAGGCGRAATSVDHNHSTGEIRGLLCRNCNTVLGMAQDNPAVLRALISYLEAPARLAVVQP